MLSRHSEWRKLAKKLRRKRIRQRIAKEREENEQKAKLEREKSPTYQEWLRKEEQAEEFRLQQEQEALVKQEARWLELEKIAQEQWKELQKKLAQIREERARQNAKIKEEWEREQKKLKELKELKQKEIEEKERQQELLKRETDNFIANGGEIPAALRVKFESNPGKINCPFFSKTATCRFGDVCSRNHIRPGISKIVLIPNFYSHYSLSQTDNEHGSSSLEFENSEIQEHFREFFFDVVPEMEKCGRIRRFIVCCNTESHLRGNVFVEYITEREAVRNYKMFNGRWYAGKQLNVHFCEILSWGAAICGLSNKQKCPKGTACNFIHPFHNPKSLYSGNNDRRRPSPSRLESQRSSRREWRWSESPEHDKDHEYVEWEDRIENADSERNRDHRKSNGNKRKRRRSDSEENRRRRDSSSARSGRRRKRSRCPSRRSYDTSSHSKSEEMSLKNKSRSRKKSS